MAFLRDYLIGDEVEIIALLSKTLERYAFSVDLQGLDADIVNIDKSYILENGAFRVLVDDNKVIGFYGIRQFDNDTCELRKMYLGEEYHGQKLGSLMLEDSISTAIMLGYRNMILETSYKFSSAIKMYKRHGFKYVKPYSDNQYCDYAMFKRLKE